MARCRTVSNPHHPEAASYNHSLLVRRRRFLGRMDQLCGVAKNARSSAGKSSTPTINSSEATGASGAKNADQSFGREGSHLPTRQPNRGFFVAIGHRLSIQNVNTDPCTDQCIDFILD